MAVAGVGGCRSLDSRTELAAWVPMLSLLFVGYVTTSKSSYT